MKLKLNFGISLMALVLLTSGCSEEKVSPEEKLKIKEEAIETGLDSELTLAILKEDKVQDAYVQEIENNVKAVLELEKDISDEEKQNLVNKYEKELKEKYPDTTVNVIVRLVDESEK